MNERKTVEDFKGPWQDKVNWEVVDKFTEEYGLGAVCMPFGRPINGTVIDAVNTVLDKKYADALKEAEVEPVVQPSADIKEINENGTCIDCRFHFFN